MASRVVVECPRGRVRDSRDGPRASNERGAIVASRAEITAAECRALVAAAADLSMSFGLAWAVRRRDDPTDLAADLRRCRAEGRTFVLPPEARGWFPLTFAHPDAGFSLAIMFLWAIGAADPRAAEEAAATPREALVWYLDHALPSEARGVVPRIAYALPGWGDVE